MNYDIKIINNYEGVGKLELNRMAFLSNRIKSIAQKALLLQLYGYSKISLPQALKKQLNIFFIQSKAVTEETQLTLDADNFQAVFAQIDAFRDIIFLQNLTPVSLVIKTFRAALTDEEDRNLLDEPIIADLIKFKNFFRTDTEYIALSNRGTIPEIQFSKREVEQIESLYGMLPSPERMVINGIVDEMKFSKKQLTLITEGQQKVVVLPSKKDSLNNVKEFFGREITLVGTAHFKSGGQLSYIIMDSFSLPSAGDRFFSQKPHKMDIQQQVALQIRENRKANPLNDILGKWPGDESDDEFNNMMKALD